MLKNLGGRRERLLRCLRSPQNSYGLGAGWRKAATCASRLGPLSPKVSNFFMFCPAAMSRASAFTFSNLRNRNYATSANVISPVVLATAILSQTQTAEPAEYDAAHL